MRTTTIYVVIQVKDSWDGSGPDVSTMLRAFSTRSAAEAEVGRLDGLDGEAHEANRFMREMRHGSPSEAAAYARATWPQLAHLSNDYGIFHTPKDYEVEELELVTA